MELEELKEQVLAKWRKNLEVVERIEDKTQRVFGLRECLEKDGFRIGPYQCAYCAEFLLPCRPQLDVDCLGCPVLNATGGRYCFGTPYVSVERMFLCGASTKYTVQQLVDAVREEVEFLESL